MRLNSYETIYIIKSNLTEKQITQVMNNYKNFLNTYGGVNILIQHRGTRHLNYIIDNYSDGIYVQMNYNGTTYLVNSVKKLMLFDQNILRSLTIKQAYTNKVFSPMH